MKVASKIFGKAAFSEDNSFTLPFFSSDTLLFLVLVAQSENDIQMICRFKHKKQRKDKEMLGLKMAKHANYNHPLLGFCLNSKFTINLINNQHNF